MENSPFIIDGALWNSLFLRNKVFFDLFQNGKIITTDPCSFTKIEKLWVWDFEWDDTLETGSNIHQISLKAKSKSSHPFKDSHSQKHTLWSPTNIAMTAWWSGSGPEISYARPGQDCDIAGVWDWNTWFEIEKLDAWNILPLFLILLNIHSIFDMASSPWEEL